MLFSLEEIGFSVDSMKGIFCIYEQKCQAQRKVTCICFKSIKKIKLLRMKRLVFFFIFTPILTIQLYKSLCFASIFVLHSGVEKLYIDKSNHLRSRYNRCQICKLFSIAHKEICILLSTGRTADHSIQEIKTTAV